MIGFRPGGTLKNRLLTNLFALETPEKRMLCHGDKE